MTHSYRGTYWANTEKSSLKRWENIVEATKQLKAEYGIDFIIPYGTAVQNLRASSLNDAYEFSDDGTHLGAGLGDYVAGCCYFQSLLAPRYGVSILGAAAHNVGQILAAMVLMNSRYIGAYLSYLLIVALFTGVATGAAGAGVAAGATGAGCGLVVAGASGGV